MVGGTRLAPAPAKLGSHTDHNNSSTNKGTPSLRSAMAPLILMVGGVTGAQFGARAGQKIRGEHLRLLLGLIVLSVGVRFAFELGIKPAELFTVRETAASGGAS